MNWLIVVEAGRLLGDQRYRGTKVKTITSCDNAFVTNIVLARDPAARVKRLIGRPQESAQPERKSTPRFDIMSFILVRNGYDGILQKMRDTLKM